MAYQYFDAHCHLQFDSYKDDQVELLERMKERGVAGIVVGVDRASSEASIALAERHEHLFASVGLHPNRVVDEEFSVSEYQSLAAHPKVVAIGECGLDYFRPNNLSDGVKAAQRDVLLAHGELAVRTQKPLIIHSRPSKGTQDAYQDLIALLTDLKRTHPDLRGDIHFFVGTQAEAAAFQRLHFTVSFTAVITFAREYDSVIRSLPLTSILSETDAPYVPPVSRPRGSRNDPLAVEDVVGKIAEIRGEDIEIVRQTILENARSLFKIDLS